MSSKNEDGNLSLIRALKRRGITYNPKWKNISLGRVKEGFDCIEFALGWITNIKENGQKVRKAP